MRSPIRTYFVTAGRAFPGEGGACTRKYLFFTEIGEGGRREIHLNNYGKGELEFSHIHPGYHHEDDHSCGRIWHPPLPAEPNLLPEAVHPPPGEESLFQLTVRRALLFSSPDEVYAITGAAHRFLAADQPAEIDAPCRVLIEPEGRNTLPAIVYGMTAILEECGDDTVAVLSSDQFVEAGDAYAAAFRAAERLAQDRLVTFGIAPTSPHTGYGYTRPGEPLPGGYAVGAFVEKPDLSTAERYMREGYLWNSGMFLFRAALFLEECRRLAPEVEEAYAQTPKISVDYGIMERTDRAAVVPLACPWSDVGSFDALYRLSEKDDAGNAVRGEYIGIDGRNNLVVSDRLVATIGLSDLAVVDTARRPSRLPEGPGPGSARS